MPSNVKIFFGLCLALVAYWVYSAVSYLTFPSADYLATLAKLPPDMRDMVQHLTFRNMMVSSAVWCTIVLALGSLATFGRQNWARWTLASVFVLAELVVLGGHVYLAIHYGRDVGATVQQYVAHNWSHARQFMVVALKIAIIAFAFSGNARPWFKRKAAA